MTTAESIRKYLSGIAPELMGASAAVLLNAALRELDELAADKRRLDWLADLDNCSGQLLLPTACVQANVSDMRLAIDCAMAIKP